MFFAPILWWLIILIFGLAGWPLAFSLLSRLPDRGLTLARPVGLLVSGYILWLGASFGLLHNNLGGILVALGLTLAIGLAWHQRQRRQGAPGLLPWLRQHGSYALGVELLFLAAFGGWTLYKAYNPNIETAGGEKWMEIAFINGILGSDTFPPQDPWLAGFGISYYYFGYVLMSMATQLTGLVSTTAFNLYIPTLLALTLTAAFGLGANLVALHRQATLPPEPTPAESTPTSRLLGWPATAVGLVAALFVGLMGNMIGVLEVLHKHGLLPAQFWTWLDIRDLKIPPSGPSDGWIPDRFIWWWRGSRVLTDYTLTGREQEVIDEFPFFSFLLGDVHPHVLALPFVLLVTALALNLLASANRNSPETAPKPAGRGVVDKVQEILENSWREIRLATGGRLGFVLYALCLGGLSFLNTWDFPIYLSVVGLAFLAWLAYRHHSWSTTLQAGIIGTGLLGLTAFMLYLPFYATFQSQARGILPNLWNPTRLPQFFVFFGPFLVAGGGLLLALSGRIRGWVGHLGGSLLLTVGGPVLLMLLAMTAVLISPGGREYIQGILNDSQVQAMLGVATIGGLLQESLQRRLANPWTFLFLAGLLGWALALAVGINEPERQPAAEAGESTSRRLAEKFVLILLLVGLGLPLAVEFIYLRDNFGIRMNTVFKFYFQAWVLLALASAFSVYYVARQLRGIAVWGWAGLMALLVAGAMVYPVLATANKANNFQGEPTLNGIAWIDRQQPDEYAAIQWLRANAPEGAVILEAPGANFAAYQYTGRVSAMTGLPTLLGWGGHESQWRGTYEEPARREPDIEQLFTTTDPAEAQQLLDKYNIRYVYVGPLERERYPPPGLQKFDQLMTVVFQQGDVTIYQR